jgi:hypothetical protein
MKNYFVEFHLCTYLRFVLELGNDLCKQDYECMFEYVQSIDSCIFIYLYDLWCKIDVLVIMYWCESIIVACIRVIDIVLYDVLLCYDFTLCLPFMNVWVFRWEWMRDPWNLIALSDDKLSGISVSLCAKQNSTPSLCFTGSFPGGITSVRRRVPRVWERRLK